MRDDEQTMYEDNREYADYEAGRLHEQEVRASCQQRDYSTYDVERSSEYGGGGRRERVDGAQQSRSGRTERANRPRSDTARARGGTSKASGALGAVGGAVAGVFGGLANKAREFSSSRAQGRTQIEEDDYLGVGTPCRLCGNPVDHLQAVCPHCGARVRPLYRQMPFWIAIAVLVLLVVVLTLAIGSCKANQTGNSGLISSTPAATLATLQADVTKAEEALADQASFHMYTRLSAYKLQQAADVANSLLGADNVSSQVLSDAATSLSEALDGLARVVDTSGYEWPYADDFAANMDGYLGKQVALTGTVSYADSPVDGSLGWSQITMSDGTTLGIGAYSVDCQGELAEGKQVTVYGVLNSDGTTYAFWCDKVEVF